MSDKARFHPTQDLAMVPGYEAIHGKPCTLDDLIALIRQFDIAEWILHLSRLATLLAGPRHRPGEYGDAFFQYVVPKDLQRRYGRWFGNAAARGNRAFVFTDRFVGILIELALLHAPRAALRKMGPGGHLVNALLMLVDLDKPAQFPSTKSGWAALMATLWDRGRLIEPLTAATRGFYLYKINSTAGSEASAQWSDLFQRATSSDLGTYFTGGLIALGVTLVKTPNEIATRVESLPTVVTSNGTQEAQGIPSAYYACRCGDIEEIAACVRQEEKKPNPNEFSLIPLMKFPLFRKERVGVLPLFLSGVAVSLCEGIYHEVMTASAENRIPEKRQHIGSVFGYLFEDYVLDLLEEFFPTRLLRRPRRTDTKNEAADGILVCPEGIIVLQIKGRHVHARDRFAWKSEEAKEDDIRRTGLIEAVDQFVERGSLSCCRKGLVPGLPFRSPAEMPIQPVVVTYEPVPLSGLLLPIVEKQRSRVQLDAYTRPLITMNVDEVEAVCSLPPADTIWRVLQEFGTSPNWQSRCLRNFLHETHRLQDAAIGQRWEPIWLALKSRLHIGTEASS